MGLIRQNCFRDFAFLNWRWHSAPDPTFLRKRQRRHSCWIQLPVYLSKGQVGAGAPLFAVNTRKPKKRKCSNTKHRSGRGAARRAGGFYAPVKCQQDHADISDSPVSATTACFSLICGPAYLSFTCKWSKWELQNPRGFHLCRSPQTSEELLINGTSLVRTFDVTRGPAATHRPSLLTYDLWQRPAGLQT